ncbi:MULTISPECIES: NAD(P)H-dependent oxidoreductase [unclassified Phenylobacterium]|uniref:NAD(P)H-dependent oxidoreductase n=1 Tax=unclassified Phenylobacterium TaxID=2640670 RepID=UPI0022B58A81|nr:NAD(P)H-dependent oxidoreductase [Phenylobacterium sp. NIBR 498073]MBS0490250.1 NAD(P)H-dependent oxidoreductase [Pseudomonadota bacterium]WGU41283.1 NAD(P)H-dependent oxidoreductase [Phenylobacterium sp. NIBR 498073]
MKHAVIVAHPARKSLNASIAQTYRTAAEKLGHSVAVRDLYAMRFDPCLKAAEIPGPKAPVFRDDVLRERARLADVDVFVFVYPLWFNAPPAILKGYVDRIFGMGFGFQPGLGGNAPALTGRRLISFTTSGAPDHWVRDTGAMTALTQLFDNHLAGTCGLTVVDHLHFGGVVSDITEESAAEVFARVRVAAAQHFGVQNS